MDTAELIVRLRQRAEDTRIKANADCMTEAADVIQALATAPAPDPVGVMEIAQRSGYPAETVGHWKYRSTRGQMPANPFPKARWIVSGEDAYDWNLDILPWLRRTGRADRLAGPRRVSPEASARALDLRQRTG